MLVSKRIILLMSLVTLSCASTPEIYIVDDVNYPSLSYQQRLQYTLSLIKANKINYNTAISNRFKIKLIKVSDSNSTSDLPFLTNIIKENEE